MRPMKMTEMNDNVLPRLTTLEVTLGTYMQEILKITLRK